MSDVLSIHRVWEFGGEFSLDPPWQFWVFRVRTVFSEAGVQGDSGLYGGGVREAIFLSVKGLCKGGSNLEFEVVLIHMFYVERVIPLLAYLSVSRVIDLPCLLLLYELHLWSGGVGNGKVLASPLDLWVGVPRLGLRLLPCWGADAKRMSSCKAAVIVRRVRRARLESLEVDLSQYGRGVLGMSSFRNSRASY